MSTRSAIHRSSPTKRSDSRQRPQPIQRQTMGGGSPNPAEMQKRLGNQGTQAWLAEQRIQPKLTIGQPGDQYEQEADRTADKVMRMSDPGPPGEEETKRQVKPQLSVLQRSNLSTTTESRSIQRLCADCEEELGGQSEQTLQRKENNEQTPHVTQDVEANINALDGKGSPLPDSTRNYFEPRFGADFSQVRVHTNTQAAETAKSINAKAFTIGNNIAFGNGQFAPNSHEGQKLMGHELTHVLQQNKSDSDFPQKLGTVQRDEAEGDNENNKTDQDSLNDEYPGQTEIRDRLDDIDNRLAQKTMEYAQAYSLQDKSIDDLTVIKLQVATIEREKFIVETIQWNSSLHLIDENEVNEFLLQSSSAAITEDMTLAFMYKLTLSNPSGLELTEYLLLNRPELFPEHVAGLYKSATSDLEEKAKQHKNNFDKQISAITDAPIEWLIKAFIYMLKHEQDLEELAGRVNFNVLLDPELPVLLERKQSDSTSFAIEELKAKVNDSANKIHPKEVEEGLGFLYPSLEAYYFYNLYSGLASEMFMLSLAVEKTYERLNRPGENLDVGADLKRAYSSGMRISAGSDYFDIHSNTASAEGGYRLAHEAIEKRLDAWVEGLSDLQKISEGFGIYDHLGEDIKTSLKSIFTLDSLKNLILFFAVITAIQFVPFGNIVADIILAGLFGVALIKMIFIFGSYFSAASNAKTFMQLYGATKELQEAGPAVVDVAVQLATFGVGKAIGKYVKSRKLKSIEELKNDPIIKDLPPEQQAEFGKVLMESKGFSKWKEKLSPKTKRMLDKNPELEKVYAEMNPTARELLTLCESPCVPEVATAELGARIEALISKLEIKEGTETFQYLREHLHNPKNRANLDPVIKEFEGLNTKAELQAKIEEIIKEGAKAKGLETTRLPDGRWQVKIGDNPPVTEYSIQKHVNAPGTKSFFQSHHGIQGAWARARIKGYNYGDSPTILLRDSKMGSPHQIVNARQGARSGGDIATRTYAQERQLLLDDMNAAGVPDGYATALQNASDGFFGKLYNQMKSNTPPAELKSIFGDWQP